MTVAAGLPAPSPGISSILVAGLAGGAVDFLYASGLALSRGRPWERPWRAVASGWIGKASGDGFGPVVLGVVTHFGIAIVMALTFVLAASRLAILTRQPLLSGVIYGLILYAVMYGVVLQVRFGAPYKWNGVISVMDVAAHVAVGVVIALVAARGARA